MQESLTEHVHNVKKQISEIFLPKNSSSSPTLPFLNVTRIRMKEKFLSHGKSSKPKEYQSLPEISIHRNPMSFVSEKDIYRNRLLKKKKFNWQKELKFSIGTIEEDSVDMDQVIKTCRELIKKKY